MNKKLLLLVAVIALALLLPGAVFAQSPGGLSYTSGVQVANLSGSTASIGLTYYNQDGSVAATVADTIAANSSKTYFPIHPAVGFNGSLVISSDEPITAIANTVTTDFKYGAATTSFSSGATTISLPLIMCNNANINTWFNIQNTGLSTASVDIDYTPGSAGIAGSESANIEPGASATFDQASGSGTLNCDDLGNPKFVGSAVITSDQPVVASVMQLNTTTSPTLLGYNSFTGGSTSVVAPLLMANNSGFFSSLNIQNVGNASTTVTADYGPNQDPGVGFEPVDEFCNLDPGESCNLLQAGGQWTLKYVGSAQVSASEELVVIVNTVRLAGGATGPFGASYEGFDPAAATSDVTAALIMSNNGGFYTSINVANVGGTACTNVNINYGPNVSPGQTYNPLDENFPLAAGSGWTIIQSGTPANNNGVNTWPTGTSKYVGSAEISGTGCTIVAVIAELAIKPGDTSEMFNGYNH